MNLKLLWTNINTVPVSTSIHRGTSPLDRNNLPPALATLTNGETEWVDTDTVAGQLYYYVLVTFTSKDRNISLNIPIRAAPRRGPGPIDLVYGDYNIGYFGMIPSNEFVNSGELTSKLALTAPGGGSITYYNYAPNWLKFARKGKIYLIPDSCIVSTGFTYKHLYDNGLIWGTNDTGAYKPSTSTARNQQRIIQIGPDRFIVRCMKGYIENPIDVAPSGTTNNPTGISEWGDFMYGQGRPVPPEQPLPNVKPDRMSGTTNIGFGIGGNGVICMDYVSADNCIMRGGAWNTTRSWLMARGSYSMTGATGAWLPVLELVED